MRTQSKHGLARVWTALSAAAIVAAGLTGVSGAWAAEPTPTTGTNSDAVVVLDDTTMWRHFHVSRSPYVARTTDPTKLGMTMMGREPWVSPLPPDNWAGLDMEDSTWRRVRWPQPTVSSYAGYDAIPRTFYPFHTSVILARGKFEVKDPAQVRSCRFSLDYWGGVAVYVNGREVARRHLPADKPGWETVAEDYPVEASLDRNGRILGEDQWQAGQIDFAKVKEQDRLALRNRTLRDVEIPAALLRKGVNVLAVECHTAPITFPDRVNVPVYWHPLGLLSARLTVSPSNAAAAPRGRPRGIQIWNCAAYDTVTAFDYGDPCEPLRPIVVRAARNSVFSGRLMVGSDQSIKGLKATVSDLAQAQGGAKILSSAVRVRYAAPAVLGKSWVVSYRFDGLLNAIPAEIPVINAAPLWTRTGMQHEGFMYRTRDPIPLQAGALAPLWFTVRVPKDAGPGVYEGTVSVAAEGLQPRAVPLRVIVSEWTVPDLRDFRVQNFLYYSDDTLARYYDVPLWSDKHFELTRQALELLAEVNSRQVQLNLAIGFTGNHGDSNFESLVRWIKQPDGSYRHDFSVFDNYLDMVAKAIGKPGLLRLNCWGEPGAANGASGGAEKVSSLDPATGKVGIIPQPPCGTAESLAFWQPVFGEILKKLKARGWLDVTTLGYNSCSARPTPAMVDVASKLWPDGVWNWSSHYSSVMNLPGTDKSFTMPVRHADTVRTARYPSAREFEVLAKPRLATWCYNYRCSLNDNSPLTDLRRVAEDMIRSGHDGAGDFGANMFPLKKPSGGYATLGWGRGPNLGETRATAALLAPGPDGPVATERFEMFREGVELAEALLYIEQAVREKKLSVDLQQRANRYLDERGAGFVKSWFGVRYMQSEEDVKLLDLAGEVARDLAQKK